MVIGASVFSNEKVSSGGSPAFMAPELFLESTAAGSQDIDLKAADIWSLGAILQ
jgi:serine/threonine protein kinase